MYVSLDSMIWTTSLKEISEEKTYRFCVRLSNELGFAKNVTLILQKYHSLQKREFALDYIATANNISTFLSNNIGFEFGTGLYFYCFRLTLNDKNYYIKRKDEQITLTNDDLEWMQFTVTAKRFQVPKWAKSSIMLQIMVDRFSRDSSVPVFKMVRRSIHENWDELPIWEPDENGEITNTDFFCGNLRGITNHLKYIKKLGVSIIYLSPICRSQSNHRYDTADYLDVDPYLGTIEDLKKLCQKAHALGIKIIIDTVFNHTGDDSVYFNRYHTFPEKGAIDGAESKYFEWYKKGKTSMFQYWWNFKNLPVCEPACKEWQTFLLGKHGVLQTWFSWGIDGIRLDVADELPDYFLTMIADCARRCKKDVFIIGEVWENGIRKNDGGRKYLLGTSLHTVMNYPFTNAVIRYVRFKDGKFLQKAINEIYNDYPKEAMLSAMNSLSTHDIPRAITSLSGEGFIPDAYEWIWDISSDLQREWQYKQDSTFSRKDYKKGKKLLQAALCIIYFLPGNPCIFYGDEVGLYGYKDPFNRKTYPWKKRDKKLLRFYRKLGKVHNSMQNLDKARFRFIHVDSSLVVYERSWKKQYYLIAVNVDERFHPLILPEKYKKGKVIFSTNKSDRVQLAPYGCVIISNCALKK